MDEWPPIDLFVFAQIGIGAVVGLLLGILISRIFKL